MKLSQRKNLTVGVNPADIPQMNSQLSNQVYVPCLALKLSKGAYSKRK